MLVEVNHRLPMLNAVKVPEEVNEAAVRKLLLEEHEIEIGPGLGPLAGLVWRIGLMGHTARPENVRRLLAVLEDTLRDRRVRSSSPVRQVLPQTVAHDTHLRFSNGVYLENSRKKESERQGI